MPIHAVSRVRLVLAGVLALVVVACDSSPGSTSSESVWDGTYQGSDGVHLSLASGGEGPVEGTLTIASGAEFPVRLRPVGDARLEGEFGSGAQVYPLTVEAAPGGRLVVDSDGNRYELRRQGANPLARAAKPDNPLAAKASSPAMPGRVDPVPGANFHHPDGLYSMKVPAGWTHTALNPSVIEFETVEDDGAVLAVIGELEDHEIGEPLPVIQAGLVKAVNEFLGTWSIRVDTGSAETTETTVGGRSGSISRQTATAEGERFLVWTGSVVEGRHAYILVGVTPPAREGEVAAVLEEVFGTLRVHGEPARTDPGSAGQRHVVFNGTRLDGKTLADLEGGVPFIPDGDYWYDKRCGMVGEVGGPTLAYVAPGLDFCGPLAADASGGGTGVVLNGRTLHPIDLAGLQQFFGAIPPGRYWMDAESNYGVEGRPATGNLLQEIAALHALMAAQGQGPGAQGGQGGYGGGGGSVYSHFPNLGAGGTGVGVADLGGGDTIVNAGGVMWWPGK